MHALGLLLTGTVAPMTMFCLTATNRSYKIYPWGLIPVAPSYVTRLAAKSMCKTSAVPMINNKAKTLMGNITGVRNIQPMTARALRK